MFDRVTSFLGCNEIHYILLYRFTVNQYAKATISTQMNTLYQSCDLSKVFDVINHKLFLNKLNHYGLRGIIMFLFHDYLSNRTYYLEIGKS